MQFKTEGRAPSVDFTFKTITLDTSHCDLAVIDTKVNREVSRGSQRLRSGIRLSVPLRMSLSRYSGLFRARRHPEPHGTALLRSLRRHELAWRPRALEVSECCRLAL